MQENALTIIGFNVKSRVTLINSLFNLNGGEVVSYISLKKQYLDIDSNQILEDCTYDEKLTWDTTTSTEVLQGMFKCSIECYSYNKHLYEDVFEDDCPCGELHFIGLDNTLYDDNFEIVSYEKFFSKYGVSKSDLMNLLTNRWAWVDIPRLSDDNEGYCFIKFNHNQLVYYTDVVDGDIELLLD